MNKVYSFSGTQSTGKTTILKELESLPFFADYNFYGSVTRKARDQGVVINSKATSKSQDEIIDIYLKSELEDPKMNSIVDRSLLDTYAYTLYFYKEGTVKKETLARVRELFVDRLENLYEHIFITMPDFDNVLDGTREDNDDFRLGVHECMMNIVDVFSIECTKLYGTTEERVLAVLSYFRDVDVNDIRDVNDRNVILRNIHKRKFKCLDFSLRAFKCNLDSECIGLYVRDSLEGVLYSQEINKDIIKLTHFYTHQNYKSVGTKLFNHLLNTAKKAGYKYLTFTMELNASGFYEKYDVKTYGIVNEYQDELAIIDLDNPSRELEREEVTNIKKLLS